MTVLKFDLFGEKLAGGTTARLLSNSADPKGRFSKVRSAVAAASKFQHAGNPTEAIVRLKPEGRSSGNHDLARFATNESGEAVAVNIKCWPEHLQPLSAFLNGSRTT